MQGSIVKLLFLEAMREQLLDYLQGFDFIDVLDLILVLLLIFILYRSVKGSIASNVFYGALILYLLWRLIEWMEMPLLGEIFDRLVSIGLIGLIVLFQPELRKFLINLGRRSPFGEKGVVSRMFRSGGMRKYILEEEIIQELIEGVQFLKQEKKGGIILVARSEVYQFDTNSGVLLNGLVSSELISSVFSEESPLREGALIVDQNQIVAAGVTLPISQSNTIPGHLGLRHRAAVGATETNEVIAIVVSQENSNISLAKDGILIETISLEQIKKEMYRTLVA